MFIHWISISFTLEVFSFPQCMWKPWHFIYSIQVPHTILHYFHVIIYIAVMPFPIHYRTLHTFMHQMSQLWYDWAIFCPPSLEGKNSCSCISVYSQVTSPARVRLPPQQTWGLCLILPLDNLSLKTTAETWVTCGGVTLPSEALHKEIWTGEEVLTMQCSASFPPKGSICLGFMAHQVDSLHLLPLNLQLTYFQEAWICSWTI